MRARTCGRQLDVQRAAASSRWTDELLSHTTTCASCREIALVTSALAGDPTAAPRVAVHPLGEGAVRAPPQG